MAKRVSNRCQTRICLKSEIRDEPHSARSISVFFHFKLNFCSKLSLLFRLVDSKCNRPRNGILVRSFLIVEFVQLKGTAQSFALLFSADNSRTTIINVNVFSRTNALWEFNEPENEEVWQPLRRKDLRGIK